MTDTATNRKQIRQSLEGVTFISEKCYCQVNRCLLKQIFILHIFSLFMISKLEKCLSCLRAASSVHAAFDRHPKISNQLQIYTNTQLIKK